MPCSTTTTSRSSSSITHPHTKKHTHHHFTTHHHPSLDHHDHHLHTHQVGPTECSSVVSTTISAPPSVVWSLLRRFDSPQTYKHFIRSCRLVDPTSSPTSYSVGSIREVRLISGIPAVTSLERLEMLDEERHVTSFRVVGGEHRLTNYRSVTSLHEVAGSNTTRVVESYLVDVPEGNTKEDTCFFADTIVRCNLHALREVVENMVRDGAKPFL